MSLRTRLQRLERNTVDAGCPACRDRRGRSVLVVADRRADGSVVLRDQQPEVCARCGIVPEEVVTVILSVVGGSDRPEQPPSGDEERA